MSIMNLKPMFGVMLNCEIRRYNRKGTEEDWFSFAFDTADLTVDLADAACISVIVFPTEEDAKTYVLAYLKEQFGEHDFRNVRIRPYELSWARTFQREEP